MTLLRRRGAATSNFRMALYPLPSLIALLGWVFIFATTGVWYILGGIGTLLAGLAAYAVWSWRRPQATVGDE